jgi:glycosyltransferase involved in cell wall biosynthesis
VYWLQHFVLGQASAVVLTTAAMQQTVRTVYGVPDSRITVIPNYVDTALFRPERAISKVPGRICFVGRLEPQKNLHALIEALAVVTRSFPAAHLVCIGDGALGQELSTLAQKLKVNVEFRGRVANALLPGEINRSEVFVLPSLYEGHPKSLIEAMACGAAVLGTRVTGIQEVIAHGETGLLCEPTAQEMARALMTLLGDPELRRRVGGAARHFAEQAYSLDAVVQQELALLHKLCGAAVVV